MYTPTPTPTYIRFQNGYLIQSNSIQVVDLIKLDSEKVLSLSIDPTSFP